MPRTKRSATKNIEKIDKNSKNKDETENLRWIDAFDSRLALRGLGWLRENRGAKSFRRMPDRAAASVSEKVRMLTHCPASAFVSFFTDASVISVRMTNEDAIVKPTVLPYMSTTGSNGAELYVREGTRWLAMASVSPPSDKAEFDYPLVFGLSPETREYRLYLPLYKHLKSLSLGFSMGAKVKPAPAPAGTKPIFIYGTSITQGAFANTAGSDFVSILGRVLETEVINFGMEGSGLGEPEMARLIREIDAEMFVLDYVANSTPETLRATLPPFVRILREKHPRLPIVLLGQVAYNHLLWTNEGGDSLGVKRDIMMRFYLETKAAGDSNLHFIDGWGVLPPGLTGAYVDGGHPTSAGFGIMAERLAPLLTMIRMRSREA